MWENFRSVVKLTRRTALIIFGEILSVEQGNETVCSLIELKSLFIWKTLRFEKLEKRRADNFQMKLGFTVNTTCFCSESNRLIFCSEKFDDLMTSDDD